MGIDYFQEFRENSLNRLRICNENNDPELSSFFKKIDSDISQLVNKLTEFDFLYPLFSCSGSPKDHAGEYLNGYITLNAKKDDIRTYRLIDTFRAIKNLWVNHGNFSDDPDFDENVYENMVQIKILIPLPRKIIEEKKDLEYNTRIWKTAEKYIDYFSKSQYSKTAAIN